MTNLSINQILDVWTDLEAAYYGKNGYGTTAAQIYMYRLMSRNPSYENYHQGNKTSLTTEAAVEMIARTFTSLYNLLTHFAERKDALVWVNGRELGSWLKVITLEDVGDMERRVEVEVRARPRETRLGR